MCKNPKCPVCQKGTIMFKDNLSCECSQCRFQCHHGQLPSIAAAIELARASSEYDKSNLRQIMVAGARLNAAYERVLEVFNA